MINFKKLTELLFNDEQSKLALLKAVQSLGYKAKTFKDASTKLFTKVSDEHAQRILAPFLRAKAIQHLKFSKTELATSFRKEYESVCLPLEFREDGDYGDINEFFVGQAKAKVFASDIESSALAEALGVNLAVARTNNNDQKIEEPRVYYKADPETSDTILLFNRPNSHFFIHEGSYHSTIGDGNCFI